MAIIVFMSWVVFWLGPQHVGPRLSVSVTSMLTLVAYRFLLGQSLPPVSYLTRLDYFLLGATVLVFIALGAEKFGCFEGSEMHGRGGQFRRIDA